MRAEVNSFAGPWRRYYAGDASGIRLSVMFELTSRILKPKRKLKPSALLLAPFCPGSPGSEKIGDMVPVCLGTGILEICFKLPYPVLT